MGQGGATLPPRGRGNASQGGDRRQILYSTVCLKEMHFLKVVLHFFSSIFLPPLASHSDGEARRRSRMRSIVFLSSGGRIFASLCSSSQKVRLFILGSCCLRKRRRPFVNFAGNSMGNGLVWSERGMGGRNFEGARKANSLISNAHMDLEGRRDCTFAPVAFSA